MLAEAKEMLAGVLAKDGKLSTLLHRQGRLRRRRPGQDLPGGRRRPGASCGETMLNDQRAGILTQGAFLATHAKADETNPITRGRTVADRVLCKDLPLPPDDIPDPKPPGEGLTTRERFAEHGANPCAQACHNIIDPLGFSFENYDAIGAWRTMDGGKPVNAAGHGEHRRQGGQLQERRRADGHAGQLDRGGRLHGPPAAALVAAPQRDHRRRGHPAGIQQAFRDSSGDLRELMVALDQEQGFHPPGRLCRGEVAAMKSAPSLKS